MFFGISTCIVRPLNIYSTFGIILSDCPNMCKPAGLSTSRTDYVVCCGIPHH